MDVGVLGPLVVVHAGRDRTPAGRMQRAILLRLLIDVNRPVSVDTLAEAIYDGREPQHPEAAIQIHVSRLRKALTGGDQELHQVFAKSPSGYTLVLGADDVDVSRFEHLMTGAERALAEDEPEGAAERLATALELWRGQPFAEFHDAAWAKVEVARLEELRLGAVESLFEARMALGGHHEMVAELQAMTTEHPLRERLWGQLIRALYLDGRQAEALRAFQQARTVLAEELGLDPCRELQELERAVLSQDPMLHAATPAPVRSRPVGPRAKVQGPPLPHRLTSFVGRWEERTQLACLLAATRLVTLTGLAGVGKTRLALELASDVRASTPALDARLVELASSTDPTLLPAAVADAVLGSGRPDSPDTEGLAAAIGDRELLLVLDNCEHLRGGCAQLAVVLLGRCPNMRIVATSQQALDVPGEAVWTVSPLSLPGQEPVASPDELLEGESVRLFCDRAGLVRPGFALTKENGSVVATICRRLDGLPLALELAAAAVAMRSVWEIAELLDDRFNLLTAGSQWVTGRHQTLLAAIDWSHNLLSPPEQILLRRLAVFAGGTTLGGAEEVCADRQLGASDVFGALTGLVAKSLVVAETETHRTRFRLLETVRAFASDRLLEAGEHAAIHENHLRWCVGLAERAETELFGPDERSWRDRLQSDLENARAALAWGLAERRSELVLRLSGALGLFWVRTAHAAEGRAWLERALGFPAGADARIRAKALWSLALACQATFDPVSARSFANQSAELWRSCEDARGEARALLVVGGNTLPGDPAGPLEVLEDAARLARQAGDPWCLSQALSATGQRQLNDGHPVVARYRLQEAVLEARHAKLPFEIIPCLLLLGAAAVAVGDYSAAEAALTEAEDRSRQLASSTLAEVLLHRSDLAIRVGRYDAARSSIHEGLALADRFGAIGLILWGRVLEGRLALGEGDLAAAEVSAHDVRSALQRSGPAASPPLAFLAEVHLVRVELGPARTVLQQALDIARARGNPLKLAEVVSGIASVAELDGDLDDALSAHRWALERRSSAGAMPDVVRSLESLALLFVRQAEHGRAAMLLAAGATIRSAGGYARPAVLGQRVDTAVQELRDSLGDEALATAWSEGSSLPLERAVALALAGTDAVDG